MLALCATVWLDDSQFTNYWMHAIDNHKRLCRLNRASKEEWPPLDGRGCVQNMPYQSMAIANEFLKRNDALGNVTQMQLQKLVYIAHGWNLALNYEPLAEDPVRAWDYGPVFPELYDHARYYGRNPIERLIAPTDAHAVLFFLAPKDKQQEIYEADLHPEELSVLDQVWNKYRSYNAFQLSDMTHREGTPWYETYFKKGKNSVIDNELIEKHYRELAELAQATD